MASEIKKWDASVTIEDDNGDQVTAEADVSGASIETWARVNDQRIKIVLDDDGRRALIRALGGTVTL